MEKFDLPAFDCRFRRKGEKTHIFDRIRKKYVPLTAEEWVRQHCVHYLITHRHYPSSLIEVEKQIEGMQKRCDILIYGPDYRPLMLVECKASRCPLGREILEQVVAYNWHCIPYLLFTNGKQHFCFKFEPTKGSYRQLPAIPSFAAVTRGKP